MDHFWWSTTDSMARVMIGLVVLQGLYLGSSAIFLAYRVYAAGSLIMGNYPADNEFTMP